MPATDFFLDTPNFEEQHRIEQYQAALSTVPRERGLYSGSGTCACGETFAFTLALSIAQGLTTCENRCKQHAVALLHAWYAERGFKRTRGRKIVPIEK